MMEGRGLRSLALGVATLGHRVAEARSRGSRRAAGLSSSMVLSTWFLRWLMSYPPTPTSSAACRQSPI